MSYLDQRPQALVEVKGSVIRARPIILAIVFVVVVIVIVIILLLLTAPKSSSSSKCTSNSGCSGLAAVCNTVTGICVECLTNTDCPSGQECITGNSCSAITCTSDSNCSASAPKCNTGNGVCVECLVPADCPIMGSNCNTNGVCIAPCTGAPNPVTNVTVTGETGTNIVSWNAPVGGQVVSDYVVNQEANICSSTVGPIVATKVVPAGTTTTAFTNLNQGFYCYRVQSQNGCGSTPIGSSPDNNGVVCGNQPTPWPDGLYSYTIDPNCIQGQSLFPDCNCICGPNGIGSIPPCGTMSSGIGNGPCGSYCSTPECPSNPPAGSLCGVDLTWNGSYPGASQLIIFTRQNVTLLDDQSQQITLLDSEATLPFPMDPAMNSFLHGTHIWYQKCGLTSTVTDTYVTAATEATVTMISPSAPDPGNSLNTLVGPNPQIEWKAVSGADYYAILVFDSNLSYGTVVQNPIIDANTGNPSYTFVSATFKSTNPSIHVYAYTACYVSEPSPGSSVSS